MPPASEGVAPSRGRGRLITFEGGEGGGKSTQIVHLVRGLAAVGIEAMATREPGGSAGAEILREVLLSGAIRPLGAAAEALLFAAARIDHIDAMIEPALAAGAWVISDRFADSTRAYQGGDVDPRLLNALERVALAGLAPDLTIILDLPAELGLARAAARRNARDADRFEDEDLSFHQAVRARFLEIAAADPRRCRVVDAAAPEEIVARSVWRHVEESLVRPERAGPAHG